MLCVCVCVGGWVCALCAVQTVRVFYWARLRLLASLFQSVCLSARNNSAATERIFVEFYAGKLLLKPVHKIEFCYNRTNTCGTLHEYQSTFIESRLILPEIKSFNTKTVEKIKIRVKLNTFCSTTHRLRRNYAVRSNRQATDHLTQHGGKVWFACRVITTKIQWVIILNATAFDRMKLWG
jgi:hypothetical protein